MRESLIYTSFGPSFVDSEDPPACWTTSLVDSLLHTSTARHVRATTLEQVQEHCSETFYTYCLLTDSRASIPRFVLTPSAEPPRHFGLRAKPAAIAHSRLFHYCRPFRLHSSNTFQLHSSGTSDFSLHESQCGRMDGNQLNDLHHYRRSRHLRLLNLTVRTHVRRIARATSSLPAFFSLSARVPNVAAASWLSDSYGRRSMAYHFFSRLAI